MKGIRGVVQFGRGCQAARWATLAVTLNLALTVHFTAAQDLPREVNWKGAEPSFVYFRYQLLPLLRGQCGSGNCHGGFTGGRLHLAPPLETGEYSNQAAQANYRSALALVDPDKRDRSLLLLKPLRPDSYDFDPSLAGVDPVPHFGPRQISHKAPPNSPERELFDALRDWVKGRKVTNYSPIAFAGRNRAVPVGSRVVLDGELSFDPNPEDQRKLRFKWELISQPADSKAKLRADTKPRPSFTADKPGTYVIRLVVRDPKRRDSEPSYVTITAETIQRASDPTALDVRTTESHEIELAKQGQLSGAARLAATADDKGRRGMVIPEKGDSPGEAEFAVTIRRPGKYGVWLMVRDRVKSAETVRGPVSLWVDGRQQATLGVPADSETWRLIRYGSTQAVKASGEDDQDDATLPSAIFATAAGVWKPVSGAWQEDTDAKKLVSTGTGFANGRNVADLGVDVGGTMVVTAVVRTTDQSRVRNGYIVFDYKSPADYKIAGIETGDTPGAKRFVMEWKGAPRGQRHSVSAEAELEVDKDYPLRLELSDNTAVLIYNGRRVLTYRFPDVFNGRVGLGSDLSRTVFDDVNIYRNDTRVYANGFGDDPREATAPAGGGTSTDDDPTRRLKRQKLLAVRLTEGKHTLKVGVYPGAPEIERVLVARLDSVADVPLKARKQTRAIYFDLLGRAPTEEELARDAAKSPGQLVRDLTGTYEFWEWLYEQELLSLDLTDTYRPTGLEETLAEEFDYNTLVGDLHNAKLTVAELWRRLMLGVYFHAKNFGAEEYTRAVWDIALDRDLLDDAVTFEAARAIYEGAEAADAPEAKKPTKPAKKAPTEWTIFGRKGRHREDLVAIVVAQPAFAERTVSRLYNRLTGLAPKPADVKRDAALLMAGWKAGREALPELVVGWLTSPEYLAQTAQYRRKSDVAFIRGLFVDLFGRRPEFSEFWGAYRIIRSLPDTEPMRLIVAGMMTDSEEADIPLKTEIVRSEWLKEQIIHLYSREPLAGEVQALDALLAKPECRMSLLVKALVTHPEYQMY